MRSRAEAKTSTRDLLRSLRITLSRQPGLRYLRNLRRWPGLAMAVDVDTAIKGNFSYGSKVSFGDGCHIIVPDGASLEIGNNCNVGRHVELGPGGTIVLGDHSSIQDRCLLLGDVSIGRYCVLSLNVLLTSGRHYFDRWPHVLIRDQDNRVTDDPEAMKAHSRPIEIGEDCWLGMNAAVMPGVTVGRGCVIGSNAVVTSDLPPYSVAVGVPAQVIRQRLNFAPPERIDWRAEEHIPYFYRGFELLAEERQRNRAFGGHVARDRFSIALASRPGRAVMLRLKSVEARPAEVVYGGEAKLVDDQWQDISVAASDGSAQLSFGLPGAGIALSDAWLT